MLLDLIKMSTHNLTSTLFDDKQCQELLQISALCTPQTPHYTLMFIFLILLNVDQHMKNYLMERESTNQHYKLTRFFLELRHETVRMFSTESTSQYVRHVDKCQELYIIS